MLIRFESDNLARIESDLYRIQTTLSSLGKTRKFKNVL